MILTSLSTQYWQLMFSQGVLVGIGNGFLFIPSFAVLPTYFVKKRALAVGIAQSGSALGIFLSSSSKKQYMLTSIRRYFLSYDLSPFRTEYRLWLVCSLHCLHHVHNFYRSGIGVAYAVSPIKSQTIIRCESLDRTSFLHYRCLLLHVVSRG
jgi:MFS family permease